MAPAGHPQFCHWVPPTSSGGLAIGGAGGKRAKGVASEWEGLREVSDRSKWRGAELRLGGRKE